MTTIYNLGYADTFDAGGTLNDSMSNCNWYQIQTSDSSASDYIPAGETISQVGIAYFTEGRAMKGAIY